ncbi:Mor transcription activator family protein [Neisseriaceae bacterium ESL0693]|nr:Mor transcription activator family protein [Neisseriaceae bacterium ESL0693]
MLTLENFKQQLPDIVCEFADVIGWQETEALIKTLGGINFDFCLGIRDSKRLQILYGIIGEEKTHLLLRRFGGSNEYIPRCQRALRSLRNARFQYEFTRLTELEHKSGRMAMIELCPQYGITDRTGWNIVRKHNQL